MPIGKFFRKRRQQKSSNARAAKTLAGNAPQRRRLRMEPLESRQMLAVLFNSGTPDDMVFDLPAGVDEVFLEDDSTTGNQRSQLRSADGSFTTTPFDHPTGSLTINAGSGQVVTISLQESLGAADLTINTPETIRAGSVTTTGTITLSAIGDILEFGSDEGTDIRAGKLALIAGRGISYSDALETEVAALEAESGTIDMRLSNIGTVTIGGVSDVLSGLRVQSSGNIHFDNVGSILLADTDGEQIIRSGSDSGHVHVHAFGEDSGIVAIVDNTAMKSPAGDVRISARGDILLGTGGTAFANSVYAHRVVWMTAFGDVVISGNSTVNSTGSGLALVVEAKTFSLLDTAAVTATTGVPDVGGGGLILASNRVKIDSAASLIADREVNIGTISGGSVDLGSVTDVSAALELSDAELNRVFSPMLRITAGSNDIAVTALVAPQHVTEMFLSSPSHIATTTPTAGIQVPELRFSNGSVDFGNSTTTDVSKLAANVAYPGAFRFRDNAGDLTIGGIETNWGISTRDQPIDITVAAGDLIVAEPISAGEADITLSMLQSGAGIVNHSSITNRGIHTITLSADDFDLQPGSEISAEYYSFYNPPLGVVELRANSPGVSADLGSAATGMNFTQEELGTIRTQLLRITAKGDINISEPIVFFGLPVEGLSLDASLGAITESTPGEQADIGVRNLALRSGAGIGEADDIDTEVAELAFSNAEGAVQISNAIMMYFRARPLDGLAGGINTGTTTNISAMGSINIEADITTTGDTVITTVEGTAASHIGIGRPLHVTSGNLWLRAADNIGVSASIVAAGSVDFMMGYGDHDGSSHLTIAATVDGATVNAIGGTVADVVYVDFGRGVNLPNGLIVQGGDGDDDVLFVIDGGGTGGHRYDVSDNGVIRDLATTITTSDVERLNVLGSIGADTFNAIPSVSTSFAFNGAAPGPSAEAGDVLNVAVSGVIRPRLTAGDAGSGFSGSYSFSNRLNIGFSGIETLNPSQFDLVAHVSSPAKPVAPGETLTYSLTYRNDGISAAEGVVISVQLPVGTVFDATRNWSGWAETSPGSGIYQLQVGRMSPYTTHIGSFSVIVSQPVAPGQTEVEFVTTISYDGDVTLDLSPENNTATHSTKIADYGLYAVAADAGGGPHVRVFGPDGAERFSFFAYSPNFTGGVRVAMGDVTGDGTADIITAAGPGGGPHVRVFDGLSGQQVGGAIGSFFAYDAGFACGVFIAAADFNGDGQADIVTGADRGGGPHIRVFSGADGSVLLDFFENPKIDGGVRVATGDINGDGTPDIITAPGPGTFPAEVHTFDGKTGQPIAGSVARIAAYPGFRGGVYVASGDVNGDGRDDIITGAGAGGGPHVRAFSGVDGAELASFFAYDVNFRGGVRVGVSDIHNDGVLEILTAAGPGGGPHVRAFAVHGNEVAGLFAFSPSFTGGVFVAGSLGAPIEPAPSFVVVSHENPVDDWPGSFAAHVDDKRPSTPYEVQILTDEVALPAEDGSGADLLFSDGPDDDWRLPETTYLAQSLDDSRTALDTYWEDLADVAAMA